MMNIIFQFTTSKRRSTRQLAGSSSRLTYLSIHDLQEEVDISPVSLSKSCCNLSIHDLQEEVDCIHPPYDKFACNFQFTTSKRRSTTGRKMRKRSARPFNSRPPRGGRHTAQYNYFAGKALSIHDLQEEVDLSGAVIRFPDTLFQFTTSKRRSTNAWFGKEKKDESFNSRPPRGGRQFNDILHYFFKFFQFTTSKRRSTHLIQQRGILFSSFNSRPPRGGRQMPVSERRRKMNLSIHDLQEEVDSSRPHLLGTFQSFNSRPPRGGRQ